jgi:toxin-antitoxin system PIN domain toxin
MIVDANVLLYAVDDRSAHHARAVGWLNETLSAGRRVGLPWETIGAFLRIVTHPRVFTDPLDPVGAWSFVEEWLALEQCWIPRAGRRTAGILGELVERHRPVGKLVPDAQLVALAIEHGVPIVSADADFARFAEITWVNPLDPR